jgi:hypothetical protein
MAVLYITEYADTTKAPGTVQVGAEPAITNQTVAIGGTSTQSAAFNSATRMVRIHTDAICSIRFGTNPTATATTGRLAANQTEYFGVVPKDKVAVITNV